MRTVLERFSIDRQLTRLKVEDTEEFLKLFGLLPRAAQNAREIVSIAGLPPFLPRGRSLGRHPDIASNLGNPPAAGSVRAVGPPGTIDSVRENYGQLAEMGTHRRKRV